MTPPVVKPKFETTRRERRNYREETDSDNLDNYYRTKRGPSPAKQSPGKLSPEQHIGRLRKRTQAPLSPLKGKKRVKREYSWECESEGMDFSLGSDREVIRASEDSVDPVVDWVAKSSQDGRKLRSGRVL